MQKNLPIISIVNLLTKKEESGSIKMLIKVKILNKKENYYGRNNSNEGKKMYY